MKASKRLFDILAASAGLVVLLPVLLAIAVAIVTVDGRMPLFQQMRVGRNGRSFPMVKFRTMLACPAVQGLSITVAGDARVGRIGRWLRHYKLDELPQLWNVLRGEMSVVGPRPEVPEYVRLYSEAQRRVLDYAPGITDPATLLFRDEEERLARAPDPERTYIETLIPAKLESSLAYARTASFRSDIRVISLTLLYLLPVRGSRWQRALDRRIARLAGSAAAEARTGNDRTDASPDRRMGGHARVPGRGRGAGLTGR